MKASVRDVLRRLGMVLAGASTLVVALVLTMAIRASRRYKQLKLPGPPDHLLLGSAAQLKKIADSVTNDEGLGRLVLFSELRRLYGDVVKMRLGLDTYVLINSREALRTVGKWPKAEQYERLQILWGRGLLLLNGAEWKKHRTMMTFGFAASSLRAVTPCFQHASARFVEELKQQQAGGGTIDFSDLVGKVTLDIIGVAGFAVDLEALKGSKDFALIDALSSTVPMLVHPLGALGGHLGTHLLRLYHSKSFAVIDEAIFAAIDARMREGKSTRSSRDLLDLLVEARDADGEPLSRQQIRDEAFLFFVAGYETTALTLQWALAHLAQNPRVWNKMREEVLRVCTEGEPVGFDHVGQLVYMKQVLLEVLRKHPPAFAITRAAPCDTEIDGFALKKGTTVMIPVHNIQNDPNTWANPTGFEPELHFGEDAKPVDPLSFIPFSYGPRNCVGQAFFWIEGRVILADMVRAFPRVTLANQAGVPPYTLHTGTAHPAEHILIKLPDE